MVSSSDHTLLRHKLSAKSPGLSMVSAWSWLVGNTFLVHKSCAEGCRRRRWRRNDTYYQKCPFSAVVYGWVPQCWRVVCCKKSEILPAKHVFAGRFRYIVLLSKRCPDSWIQGRCKSEISTLGDIKRPKVMLGSDGWQYSNPAASSICAVPDDVLSCKHPFSTCTGSYSSFRCVNSYNPNSN